MLEIDGAAGEGGGQVLRSALCLSMISRKPFRIANIRGGRKRPGLLRQHLTGVNAACAISSAEVLGNTLGSTELEFHPGLVKAGDYSFAIGSAGSTGLVLQTVLPALGLADGPSTIELKGGTHNPWAPPFDFLVTTLFPLLKQMGVEVEGELHRPGFYPAGGGHVSYRIKPAIKLAPIELMERGEVTDSGITVFLAKLQPKIAQTELTVALKGLGWPPDKGSVERLDNATGPGNMMAVFLKSQHLTEVVTAFGEKGVYAEKVARGLAKEANAYLDANVPVGAHLADQLLLWLAVAGGGSFRTVEPTGHTKTQCDVIRMFLDVGIEIEREDEAWTVRVLSFD